MMGLWISPDQATFILTEQDNSVSGNFKELSAKRPKENDKKVTLDKNPTQCQNSSKILSSDPYVT